MSLVAATRARWEPDALVEGWESLGLPAPRLPGVATPGSAREAVPPVLTLVRRAHRPARPVGTVVLVHGYNDYVFQDHVVGALAEAGWDALGVDLRRAGRSLRPGQVLHYVDDLRETAADLGVAVAAARRTPGPVVVHAHSTGALVAALWAHAHRGGGGCDALVLDSPFLDLRASWVERTVGTRVLDAVGPWSPLTVVSAGPSAYTGHLLADRGGRWTFDTTLKRPEGVPVRAGWLRAVRQGHARVARGLEVACPVLVARAERSGTDDPTSPDRERDLDASDTVLDVAQIARLAPRLGRDVTELVVPGAVHDLTLSADGPRASYLGALAGWLDERVVRVAA
ncbi:alpha/beta hydrolase [Cellulosimicrobium cellulans]|uniref:alpha/beta hydrolase n=1 Tax=Cellulosimicrobium cellulans TaxID=1710 RepID=UPI0020975606|nr:alpha/beta hydrolase [Cellulosimicrobium cellulans]MCO7271723.1 alpha/beta hydrolase [Cellulosimicrobium cellulans]